MKTHPFEPLIFKNTRKLVIGTLPPESATYYFSNSSNTRLWDILKSIQEDNPYVSRNSNLLSKEEKHKILKSLSLGIYDIIYKYERIDINSTKDKDIIPLEYSNILDLIENTKVEELLFVYKNAAKWFLHSLTKIKPVKCNQLKNNLNYGIFKELILNNRKIACSLLPTPLNRGKLGETLKFKLDFYKTEITK